MLKFANKVLSQAKNSMWEAMGELAKLSDELRPMILWKGKESPKLEKAYKTLEIAQKQVEKCLDVYEAIQKGIEEQKTNPPKK